MALITIELDTTDLFEVQAFMTVIEKIAGLTSTQAAVRANMTVNPIRADLMDAAIDGRLDDARDYLNELVQDALSE